MWRLDSLLLLYALAGLAVWTWVIRNHHRRPKQRARGLKRLRRRRRFVEVIGVASITLVALLSAVLGLVDASGGEASGSGGTSVMVFSFCSISLQHGTSHGASRLLVGAHVDRMVEHVDRARRLATDGSRSR